MKNMLIYTYHNIFKLWTWLGNRPLITKSWGHSRTEPDFLISYNSYIKGVSCPTVGWCILALHNFILYFIINLMIHTLHFDLPLCQVCLWHYRISDNLMPDVLDPHLKEKLNHRNIMKSQLFEFLKLWYLINSPNFP